MLLRLGHSCSRAKELSPGHRVCQASAPMLRAASQLFLLDLDPAWEETFNAPLPTRSRMTLLQPSPSRVLSDKASRTCCVHWTAPPMPPIPAQLRAVQRFISPSCNRAPQSCQELVWLLLCLTCSGATLACILTWIHFCVLHTMERMVGGMPSR